MGENAITFEEELNRSGRLVYTNVGVSMMPLLRQGRDVMLIEKRDPKDLRRFDAVFFKRPGVTGRGAYVMHRILRILPDGNYWIVGDNCTSGEIVPPADILKQLEEETTPEAIHAYLMQKYPDYTVDEIGEELAAFLTQLLHEGLLIDQPV